MAISSGIFSTFLSTETVPLLKFPSLTSTSPLRFLAAPPANPRMDPSNKKNIICDEKLKKIFAGKDQVGFLEIAGLISPHFLK
ncbi:hypothetical protein D5086_018271 [Populus alba]|uniref:Uncharacterized protein n=1 Tax=Populus alba TaxID=43335 RepID=A0ACC4BPU9_POPAL